jgi:hypothetical protein
MSDMVLYPSSHDAPNNHLKQDHQLTYYRSSYNVSTLDIPTWERILSTVKDDANTYLEVGTSASSLEWMLRNILTHKESKAFVANLDEQDIYSLQMSEKVTVLKDMEDAVAHGSYRIVYVPSHHHMLVDQAFKMVERNGLLILDT